MGAVNRPEPVLWITLAAIPANALLVWLLMYGEFGLPRLGIFGIGLASSIVNFATFVAGLWFATRRPPFVDYRVLTRFWRIDWSLMRQLVVIGAPISISFLLEYGLFSAAALLMGRLSTTALAAHQIALQITAILFMVPFGISMAATVRVGHAVGRGDGAGVRRAGLIAMLIGIAFAALCTIAVILLRFSIARLFHGRRDYLRRRDDRARRGAVADRGNLLHHRRAADDRGGRAARTERHQRAAAVRRDQLLAGRILPGVRPRIPYQPRSARRVDRIVGGTLVYAVLLVVRFRLLATKLDRP